MDDLTVFVRIVLFVVAGNLMSGGLLPSWLADLLYLNPQIADMIVGGLVAAGTYVWYWFSKARRRLKGLW